MPVLKKHRKPKGWVDKPKTLADVVQSLESLGCNVDYCGKGKINPRKVRL